MTPPSHSLVSLAVAIVLPFGFIAVIGGISSPVFYLYAMGAVRFTRRLGRVGRKGDRVEVAAVV